MKKRIREKVSKKIDFAIATDRGRCSVRLPGNHPQVVRGMRQYLRYVRLVASRPGFPAHMRLRVMGFFDMYLPPRDGKPEVRWIDREPSPWQHRYYSPRKDRLYRERASRVLSRLDGAGYVMPSYNFLTDLTREMIRRGDLFDCPEKGWLRSTDTLYLEE